MTDKEIIINGIDVSECAYLKPLDNGVYECIAGTQQCLKYRVCECNHNCYYKQLKRKEEELRNICKAFDIEYVIDKETGSLIGRCNKLNKKQQECEELKFNENKFRIDAARAKMKASKYKQALDEIEHQVRELFLGVENKDRPYCEKVLDIINKVKDK